MTVMTVSTVVVVMIVSTVVTVMTVSTDTVVVVMIEWTVMSNPLFTRLERLDSRHQQGFVCLCIPR